MSKSDELGVMGRFRIVLFSTWFVGAVLFGQQVWAQVVDAASAPARTVASAPELLGISAQPVLPAPANEPPPPTWLILSSAQKAALMPLERDWNGMDSSSRSKWLSIATRFAALPAEEQARMHERMRAWARSSPAERQQVRIAFHAAQQMAATQRQAKWEAYQALPPEKRREFSEKAAHKLAAKPLSRRMASNDRPQPKSNLVPAMQTGQAVKVVAPLILQARPGATTVFITQIKSPPVHQQAGQTKVFADPDLVDSKTLLPKRRLVEASP